MANLVPDNVDLKEGIDDSIRNMMLFFNCHGLATIESFNPDDQTCVAVMNYSKKYNVRNDKGLYVSELAEYPILADCPIIILSGGKGGLTFPISKGDQAILLFNDRDIDNWFEGATSGEVSTSRLHSFTDALALIGPRSLKRSIKNYDSNNVVLFNDQATISLSKEKIKLENAIESFMQIQTDFIDAIKGIVTTNCVVGSPVVLSPSSQAQLDLINTRFEGLLE